MVNVLDSGFILDPTLELHLDSLMVGEDVGTGYNEPILRHYEPRATGCRNILVAERWPVSARRQYKLRAGKSGDPPQSGNTRTSHLSSIPPPVFSQLYFSLCVSVLSLCYWTLHVQCLGHLLWCGWELIPTLLFQDHFLLQSWSAKQPSASERPNLITILWEITEVPGREGVKEVCFLFRFHY